MKHPKVAVIIPSFNKSKFIEEAILSVINQTYKNLEIIIVDDNSTDRSVSVVKRLSRQYKNIKLFCLTKNHGVSFCRNYGANKATSDYLTFLDADDIYINPKKIENEVKIADVDKIAFSQWVPADINGKILHYRSYKHNPYASYFAISKILAVSLPPHKQLRGYMVSRKLFNKIGGYDTSLSLYEDFDFQCRLGLAGKFVYTKEIGEGYRLNTGGLSSKVVDGTKNIKLIRSRYISNLRPLQKKYYNFLSRNI